MAPSSILDTPNYGQCYLPPVRSLLEALEEAKLSENAILVIGVLVFVFTLAIAVLADIIVAGANINALKHRVSQIIKADAALNALQNTKKPTPTTYSTVNALFRINTQFEIIDEKRLRSDFINADAKHKYLNLIQGQIQIAVTRFRDENNES